MASSDDESEVSKWAVFKPFRRPLALNLLVPILGAVIWYVTFVEAVDMLGLSSLIAERSEAGQIARTKASIAPNFALGVFIGVATLAAYGWHIWNLFLGGVFAVHSASFYFWVQGLKAPSKLYTSGGYTFTNAELARVLAVMLAFLVPAFVICFGIGDLIFRGSAKRQLKWWTKLPK